NPETFAAEIKSRPPVLLVHGNRDDLIPPQALFRAAGGLAALGVPVEWHMSYGIGHGIDPDGLRHGGEFLARRLASVRGPWLANVCADSRKWEWLLARDSSSPFRRG